MSEIADDREVQLPILYSSFPAPSSPAVSVDPAPEAIRLKRGSTTPASTRKTPGYFDFPAAGHVQDSDLV
jgi:hypothetical protein